MSQASAATVTVHEWLPHLEKSASEVFELMLNSKLRKGTLQLFAAPECTAMVGIAGSIRGLVTVRCGGATANQLAATMLRLPPERAAHYAADALGEIANMLAGNFKNKTDKAGDKSFLSSDGGHRNDLHLPLTFKRGPAGTLVPVPRRTAADYDGSADLSCVLPRSEGSHPRHGA